MICEFWWILMNFDEFCVWDRGGCGGGWYTSWLFEAVVGKQSQLRTAELRNKDVVVLKNPMYSPGSSLVFRIFWHCMWIAADRSQTSHRFQTHPVRPRRCQCLEQARSVLTCLFFWAWVSPWSGSLSKQWKQLPSKAPSTGLRQLIASDCWSHPFPKVSANVGSNHS